MPDEPSPRERFQTMLTKVAANGQLGAWNHAVDWSHGEREMADFYAPLSSQNRLYIEWV
jgi:hypothetical protein